MILATIQIEDVAVTRLTWKELMTCLDEEFAANKKESIRVLRAARARFGLEVTDGTSEEGDTDNEQDL